VAPNTPTVNPICSGFFVNGEAIIGITSMKPQAQAPRMVKTTLMDCVSRVVAEKEPMNVVHSILATMS